PPLAADVSCERHALSIGKGSSLAADFDCDGGPIGRPHAEHTHRLKIAVAVTRRLDAPGAQMILDVRRRQPDAGAEYCATFELIRRDVGEPFLQILGPDGRDVSARRRASGKDRQRKSESENSG